MIIGLSHPVSRFSGLSNVAAIQALLRGQVTLAMNLCTAPSSVVKVKWTFWPMRLGTSEKLCLID